MYCYDAMKIISFVKHMKYPRCKPTKNPTWKYHGKISL